MAHTMMGSLREVQALDDRIREADEALATFDDRLAAVEKPARALEAQLAKLEKRLAQMRLDERRLERAAEDTRARGERLALKLNRVTTMREELAVQTELDHLRRAVERDELEALHLLDQIHRSEATRDQLEASAAEARAEVLPQQGSLRAQREGFEARRAAFRARREAVLEAVGYRERRVYEAFFHSGQYVIVAALLDDGACGHCFGIIPLQLQNDIRRSGGLIRCEGCGVILTTEPEPELDEEVQSPVEIPDPVEPEEPASDGGEAESPPGGDE